MARTKSLASMSVDTLVALRDEIGSVLNSKAAILKKELAALGADYAEVGRIAVYGKKKSLAGTKVPPKYRGPGGETWAGRGGMPLWMREAMKGGKKREDFLIAKPNGAPKSRPKKLGRPKKKR
jgi:DNA-binding protein H-NS